jgi:hypothetical protein
VGEEWEAEGKSSSAKAYARWTGVEYGRSGTAQFDSTGDRRERSAWVNWWRGEDLMKQTMLLVLVISATVVLAQNNNMPNAATTDNSRHAREQMTVRGCVSTFNGDFILVKQDPGITYELHSTGKMRLSRYLGRRVEVTGKTSPSLSTSSDALATGGAPSSLTLTASSIKTISKECTEPLISDK